MTNYEPLLTIINPTWNFHEQKMWPPIFRHPKWLFVRRQDLWSHEHPVYATAGFGKGMGDLWPAWWLPTDSPKHQSSKIFHKISWSLGVLEESCSIMMALTCIDTMAVMRLSWFDGFADSPLFRITHALVTGDLDRCRNGIPAQKLHIRPWSDRYPWKLWIVGQSNIMEIRMTARYLMVNDQLLQSEMVQLLLDSPSLMEQWLSQEDCQDFHTALGCCGSTYWNHCLTLH